MSSRSKITEELIQQGVIAVVRLRDSKKLMKVVEAVAKGGVKAIEITLTNPRAMELIAEAEKAFGNDILLGAGSVLSPDAAQRAIDAGARYIVSPVFNADVLSVCHRQNIPSLPGAFTPTEIQNATEAGADIVKVFPAGVVGMSFFKAVLAPMPHCKLMPTGGVSIENAGDWIRAGACAVGIGSALIDLELIERDAFDTITSRATSLQQAIDEARS